MRGPEFESRFTKNSRVLLKMTWRFQHYPELTSGITRKVPGYLTGQYELRE